MSDRLVLHRGALRLSRPSQRAAPWLAPWIVIRTAWRRHCTRQRIVHLDRHLLKDIGISFADAETEANKPFWRS